MIVNRILLVSTNRFNEPFPVYPLALSYLQSILAKRFGELEIKLFDFNRAGLAEFKDLLAAFQPDLVGISLRNIDTVNIFDDRHFIQENRDLVREIKSTSQSIVILGGSGFSIFPESLFDLVRPDFGVFGEGEETLCQLIQLLKSDGDYSGVAGLLFRQNDQTVFNRNKRYCTDPEPVFDTDLVDHYWAVSGMMNLQTKRGCPYQCVYCTYPLIDGHVIRTQPAEQVVTSLRTLYESKGIDYFFFTDSVFNIENEFNRELAEQIIAAKLTIRWGAYFTPHHLDQSLLTLLQRSGLTHAEFGTESLSNSTLKSYNKRFSVDEVLETDTRCKQAGVHTAHFMILGGIGETEASIEETIRASNRIDQTVFFPYFGMRIYPETKVYDQALAEGKIKAGQSILPPTFYLADNIDYSSIKQRARATANRWIFPDESFKKPIDRMRKKGMKGPLWEMLIKK
jgi:radical SAM superfamily enzyme YgiQ (UPF0313 family)